jgi:asparagine synthase (glutamine-hydrolysing)
MPHLGGILHPSSFKMNELVGSMSQAFSAPPSEFLRHKNLELAIFGATLPTKDHRAIHVLLNGNIRNSNELRIKLEALGLASENESDEEIIRFSYLAWGESFMNHLEGDFACALLDCKKDLLYLVRDRIGKKTLYWTTQGEYFLFSTDLKGLLATGVVPQSPSLVGLSSYLYFGYIPQDLTPVLGVNKLLPGYFLKMQLSGKFLIEQYWSLSKCLIEKEKRESADFEKILGKTVSEACLQSSVGLLDHGGRGISLIHASLEKKMGSKGFTTFHPTFEEPESTIEDLVEMVWHLDEPTADLTLPGIWQAVKKASEISTQTLIIDAGWEEMIAISSQAKHSSPSLAYRLAKLPAPIRSGFVLPLVGLLHPSFKWKILRNIEINRDLMGYLSQIALFKGMERKHVSPSLYHQFDPEIFIERFHRISEVKGEHDLMFYFNAKTKIPDSILLQHENLSAPFSIDISAPFLESQVLNFATSVEMNVASSYFRQDERVTNSLCRSPYFRELFELLTRGVLVRQDLISAKWIRHQLGFPFLVPGAFKKLWAILILEIWFRLYINQPIGKASLTISVDELLRS